MASSEKENQTDNTGDAGADDDGLTPEQEDALNKIMAEIEAGDDSDAEASDAASPDGADDKADASSAEDSEDGLDADQEAALNKIMAEIEAQDNPSADAPVQDTAETDTAKVPSAPEDDGEGLTNEGRDDEGLSGDQQEALEKIMAEIEGQTDAAVAEAAEPIPASTPADKTDAPADAEDDLPDTEDGSQAQTATEALPADTDAPEPVASDADAEAPVDDEDLDSEGLSPDQEEALNKIMAEIDAKDASSTPEEDGLTDEQEAALNNIMAEIEGQAEADEQAAPDKAPPAQPISSVESGSDAPSGAESPSAPDPAVDSANQTASPNEAQSEDPSSATDSNGDAQAPAAAGTADSPPLPEAGNTEQLADDAEDTNAADADAEAPDSTVDLLSQIQAAAQGPEEERATEATEPEAAASPPPSTAKEAPEGPPPPLAEIPQETAPKRKKSATSKSVLRVKFGAKKFAKIAAWTGAAAAAVTIAAAGTYLWLSHQGSPKTAHLAPAPAVALNQAVDDDLAATGAETPAPEIPATASLAVEPAPTAAGLGDMDSLTSVPKPPPAVNPDSKRLVALSEQIQAHRERLLAKTREIDDLRAYYASGIEKLTTELEARIVEAQISDFKAASKDTAVLMGLQTIQRRTGYMAKLKDPRARIHAAAEELRYLSRKADILSRISAQSSGNNLDPFAKQVDEAVERLTRDVAALSLEAATDEDPKLQSIWDMVWDAHLKTPKKVPPTTVAMRRNRVIWEEICRGDFTRVSELSALSEDAAACLAGWEGKDLFLNNIEQLSPQAAQGLSAWQGEWLVLNGLKSLSPEAARQLAAWQGKRLSLNGLKELPATATKALVQWQGHQLEMIGLTQLSAWDNPQVTLYVRSEVRDHLAR